MKKKNHFRIFFMATLVWLLFLLMGLPDYYLQYSVKTMIWFDVLLLIPFSLIIWFIFKSVNQKRRLKISFWYAFYFTVPLAVYDYLFCGIYLGYGFSFIQVFWFLSIYYLIPWLHFPIIVLLLNKIKR